MIFDLTRQFKQSYESYKEGVINPTQNKAVGSWKPSIQSQLFHKYSEDLYRNLKKITQVMEQSKDNYFSNVSYSYTAFTDQQRNEFDTQIKNNLLVLSKQINQFKEDIDSSSFRNKTEKQHMRSVVIALYQLLKDIQSKFNSYIEFNQRKKQKIINTISMQTKKDTAPTNRISVEKSLSEYDEELQKQAKMIYMQKVSEQRKIEDSKKTLENISQVLHKMSNKVLEQELLTSSFMEIGQTGLFHIQKGNKNLVEANELSKQSGMYWAWFFQALALSLLILDYLKS